MRFHRTFSLVVLVLGTSALNLLRVLDRLFGLEIRSELSQTAMHGGQFPSGQETILQVERGDGIFEANKTSGGSRSGESLCNREEIQDGSWVQATIKAPPYVSKTTHLRCYPIGEYTKGYWNTYEWQPASDCDFVEWRRKAFCSLMTRATVMIIGDSLSWEHFSSLAQLLGLRVFQNTQHESKLHRSNHVQLACNNLVRLVFRRDDILSNLSHAIETAFPQVLVMNRGAHYVNDTRLVSGIQQNIEEIKEWKAKCRFMNIKCHLFWRTSVPGHPLCDKVNFTEPINNVQEMETWIANRSNYDDRTMHYHWYDYQHQNELVIDTLYRGLGNDFDVLDAYNLNIRRPDEHRSGQGDCLHNCYPGKMDVYNQLMLHFLKTRRMQDDVDELVATWDRENRKD
jgi:hypothetical protein